MTQSTFTLWVVHKGRYRSMDDAYIRINFTLLFIIIEQFVPQNIIWVGTIVGLHGSGCQGKVVYMKSLLILSLL